MTTTGTITTPIYMIPGATIPGTTIPGTMTHGIMIRGITIAGMGIHITLLLITAVMWYMLTVHPHLHLTAESTAADGTGI